MDTALHAQIIDGPTMLDALKLRLAAQQGPRRWQKPLGDLANQLEQGGDLESAIRSMRGVPAELRCLLVESLLVADPTSVVLATARSRASNIQSMRTVARLFAYPLTLLGVSLIVGLAFSFLIRNTLPIEVYRDFSLQQVELLVGFIEDQHQAIVGMALCYGFVVLTLLTIVAAGPPWAWFSVLSGIALIGRPLRWIALRELLQRYQAFIAQGLSSVAAAEAVARSFRHSARSVAAAAFAERIAAGIAPGQALCLSQLSDGLTRPALRLLDLRGSHFPQALSQSSDLLGRLIHQQCRSLSTILPLFLLLIVGSTIWATLCTYLLGFLPLIMIINYLA